MNLVLKRLKSGRLSGISDDVLRLLNANPATILAGGVFKDVLAGNQPADYDLFLLADQDPEKLKTFLTEAGYHEIFACPRGQLFSYAKDKTKIQIVLKRRYADVWDLLNSFDFTVCYFALFDGNLHTSRQAIRDWRKKVLSLVTLTYPSSTINRLYKYRKKGYYTGSVIKDIVGEINRLPDYNPENDELYVD